MLGGNNGITDSKGLNNQFSANGATKGGDGGKGTIPASLNIQAVNDTICSGERATLIAQLSGTLPAGTSITLYSALTGGTVLGTGNVFTTPVLTTTTVYFVGLCPGK